MIITPISSRRAQIVIAAVLLLGSVLASRGEEGAQSSQFGPLGPAGAPANLFPQPSRHVSEINSGVFWTEEDRDRLGEAEKVLKSLPVRAGMTVADLGAGWGYYTVRLAHLVGPGGSVLAEDVTPDFLSKLKERVAQEHLSNVTLVLGEPHDPRLPPHSVDLVLMVHMYHEVTQPYGLLFNLLPALRPGAQVAVVENDKAEDGHATPHELLTCEFKSLGYRQTQRHQMGDTDEYFAVFEPPAQPPALEAIVPCSR